MDKEKFGREIKTLRTQKGLSLSEASEGMGELKQQLCAIEKGKRGVSEAKARKIVEFYGFDYQVITKIVKKDEK